MTLNVAIAILVLLLVIILTIRKIDVRLVLITGAVPLFLLTSGMKAMCTKLADEMANSGTVVPICAALGFAYVMQVTECDQHLVQLLLRPIRRVRMLLVPGGIAVGYLVNTTIVSQTGTAAVIGPILIPLLRAGGLTPVRAGAILLLGSSMGGELFNPGAVEMRKLAELTRLTGTEVVARSTRLNLAACGTALVAFWVLTRIRPEREPVMDPDPAEADPTVAGTVPIASRINLFKALVPVVPLFLLFADSGMGKYSLLRLPEGPSKILAAMLAGVTLAALTSPRKAGRLGTAFFEGAGYAYTHIISLIIAASTFAEGIRRSGLIEVIVQSLSGWPTAALVVSTLAPCGLAIVSGTGIAPAVSIMEFFVPVAASMGLDPVKLGTVAALGAHFGRTMSPAAAVVAMSARLAQAPAASLIREVSPSLVIGGGVLLVVALLGLV